MNATPAQPAQPVQQPETKPHQPVPHWLLWPVSLLLAAGALRYLYIIGSFAGPVWAVYLVNSRVALPLVLLVAAGALLAAVAWRKGREPAMPLVKFIATAITAAMCITALFWVGLLMRRSTAAAATEGVILDAKAGQTVAVYFDNGSPKPEPEDIAALAKVLEARPCTSANINVVGYASSAPFDKDSDNRNKDLSNDRATAVAELLKNDFPAAKVKIWEKPEDMFSHRQYTDRSGKGAHLLSREILNRRVDVQFCVE